MSKDCLFCKISQELIPANKIFEDDALLAFEDIDPKAPTHVLIIPRKHISTLNDLEDGDEAIMGRLPRLAARIARDLGIARDGYRLVLNCNEDGGQSVYHIHMHLLGGRRMKWPPG